MPADNRKEITGRIDPELWEELHEQTHKRRVSKNEAIVAGLKSWLYGPAQPIPARSAAKSEHSSMTQNQAVILERLDALHQGQSTILQVLQRITGKPPDQRPIESLGQKAHDQPDDGDSGLVGTPAHIATSIVEHGPSSKPLEAIKKNRPGKQAKTPRTGPKRRDRGTG